MLDALTLDQIELFIAVETTGSFAAAARTTNRSPSAVTYGIQKMEDQLGVTLFDRSSYRASLTAAGQSLLPRVRRVSEEMKALRTTAKGIVAGLEASLTFAVDTMFPAAQLSEVLMEFATRYPTVQLRISSENCGTVRQLVTSDESLFGLTSDFSSDDPAMVITSVSSVAIKMVASPFHPLAQKAENVGADLLRDHLQLVVTDRLTNPMSKDWSVFTGSTWRLGDIQTKLSLLRRGVGFGTMPAQMIENDIINGDLVELNVPTLSELIRPYPIALIRKADTALGPAARWIISSFESLTRR